MNPKNYTIEYKIDWNELAYDFIEEMSYWSHKHSDILFDDNHAYENSLQYENQTLDETDLNLFGDF